MAITTPTEAINVVIHDYDGTDATDQGNTDRRQTLLGFLQHIGDYIHNFREWQWTYLFEEDAFALDLGDNSSEMPERFMEFGRHGALFPTGNPRGKYDEVSMAQLVQLRVGNSGNSTVRAFSRFAGLLQFPFTASENLSFDAMYRVTPQIFTDGDEEDEEDDAFELPSQYIHTVLMPGFRFLAQQSKTDIAAGEYGGQFKDGLQQMLVIENRRKTAAQLMPMSRRSW